MSLNLTKFTEDMNKIASLDDQPALTSAQLKAKFDEGGVAVKTYLNDTLTSEVESQVATDIASCLATAKGYTDTKVAGISLTAGNVSYDNASSGMTATKVQGAIDELKSASDTTNTNVSNLATALGDLIKTQTITATATLDGYATATVQTTSLVVPSGYTLIGIIIVNNNQPTKVSPSYSLSLSNGTYKAYVHFYNYSSSNSLTTQVKLNAIYLKN